MSHIISEKCGSATLSCDRRCEKGENMKGNHMDKPSCYGLYDYDDYDHVCFRCRVGNECLDYTREKEGIQVKKDNNGETKEERKQKLDKEWFEKLPCNTCHPKMQRLCKHYNSFKRPDYNYEQFKIDEIICEDKIPTLRALEDPLDDGEYVPLFGDLVGDGTDRV